MDAPRFHVVRAANARASATEWVRLRPLRAAPNLVVVLGLLAMAHYPPVRVATASAAYGCSFAYHVAEAARARRSGADEREIFVSHLVTLATHAVTMVATGGMRSPLWAMLLGGSLGTLSLFGDSRESAITVAYTSALTVLIAVVPEPLRGPEIAAPYHGLLAAWSILFTLFMLRTSTFVLSDAYRRTEQTLDKMREDVIVAASERARSLEAIGSKVAHELKNPLSAIKGLVQLLSRSAADDRARERLEVIGSEVARMEAILRDYLSFSRPLEELRPSPVDLGAVADDVVAVLEGRAEVAGVALLRRGGRARAVGDPRRLKEALLNLVSNALEATPRGGLIDVVVFPDPERGGARIEIRDTGKGMSPEDLARIGTPFFTTREGGTGLGVVLARAVITQHGGEITYSSELGRGTKVTVRLPSRAEEGASASAPCEASAHG